MKIKKPSSKVIALVLTAVILLATIVFIMQRAGPLAPVRITLHQAVQGSFTPSIYGIGTVEARRTFLIGPTTAGRVLRVLVDTGDVVKAGQLLAEMDPIDLDNRLLALDASLARGNSTIAAAQAQTTDAAARKSLAAVNVRRYVELGQQNFMSAGAVEAKVQEHISADAGASAAQANLAAAQQDLLRLKNPKISSYAILIICLVIVFLLSLLYVGLSLVFNTTDANYGLLLVYGITLVVLGIETVTYYVLKNDQAGFFLLLAIFCLVVSDLFYVLYNHYARFNVFVDINVFCQVISFYFIIKYFIYRRKQYIPLSYDEE